MDDKVQWIAMLDQLGAHAKEHGAMPERNPNKREKSSILSVWLWRQRRAYRLGHLTEEQETLLREIPGTLPTPRVIDDDEIAELSGVTVIGRITITAEVRRGRGRERVSFTVPDRDLRDAMVAEVERQLTAQEIERQRIVADQDDDISFD